MHPSINRVTLVGTVGPYGVTVSFVGQGTARAALTVVVREVGSYGKEHQTFINCEIWGKKAEAAGELEAGDVVLLEGKLRCTKKGETWETLVSSFEAHLLQRALAGAAVVS
jgi:single-stranded DNA-binding protein